MEQERYKETGSGSFHGEYLYDQLVPESHFLRKLKGVINWGYFTKRLIQLYKGQELIGRPPFDPALILKMELIAYLYKPSERQVEIYVNDSLSAKYFVGLAVDGKAPDHTRLSAFRERLLKNGKLQVFEELLGNVVQEAILRGVKLLNY
jgi:transposase